MRLRNVEVLFYKNEGIIHHDKYMMNEKGAWHGSANFSPMALNNEQINIMIWYSKHTAMYSALEERFEIQVVSCLDLT